MNQIWIIMLLSSFFLAIVTGRIPEVITVMFDSTKVAIDTCMSMLGILCLWSGFMKIAEESGLVYKIARFVKPVIKILFPELPKENEASGHIAMNMTANLLGLGNIATPLGLKAMEALQKLNQNSELISNSMMMFLILNTASIQLIPTSVIALRSTMGASNPAIIVFPTFIASIVSVLVGIALIKFFTKKRGHS